MKKDHQNICDYLWSVAVFERLLNEGKGATFEALTTIDHMGIRLKLLSFEEKSLASLIIRNNRHNLQQKLEIWTQQGFIDLSCPLCNDTGVIETGNNDIPCDCSKGDTAVFNVAGKDGLVQGKDIKREWKDLHEIK